MNRSYTLLIALLMLALGGGVVGCAAGDAPPHEDLEPLDGGTPLDRGAMSDRFDASAADLGAPCTPAAEACNTIDDDCDGEIDETFSLGMSCAVTVDECQVAGVIQCNPNNTALTICFFEGEPGPQPEACNGLDDDCDGSVDEDFEVSCAECIPSDELCNGEDDDCDGTVDEAIDPANAPQEQCNGIDDDCDGVIDEEIGGGIAPAEVCNGLDDDCDGQTDEGDACPCRTGTFQNRVYLLCGVAVDGNPDAYNQKVSWTDAKSKCEDSGFTLVSIDSAEEDQFIYQSIAALSFGDTWIGLNDRENEGRFVWADDGVLGYSNWDGGEPNNGGGNEDCGIMLMSPGRASRWDDRPCSRSYHFVCEPR